ncbi:hypothetical protein OEZ86_010668 [Tetradesmus obliquus]|nr:hypothetical protein OEZ86_010668 [Tetradesmus obliquus]
MLSVLIMNVFTPALLLSKLGSSVDVSLALSLWPLAANMLLCHAAGLGIGWLQVQLAGIPPELRAQTLVMNTAGNIGNLPLQPPPQQQQQQPGQLSTLAKGVFTPPVIACLLAIPVAAVPELKEHLFTPTGGLHVLGEALAMLGAPLIPCLFLVLGANLAEGPGAAQVPPKFLLSMIAGKLLLHPLAGMALVLGALKLQLLPQGLDPLVPLVMMMVWATPTAVLVHSLATMLRNGEDQVSCYLFWQYLASLATLPAFMALYLQLLQSGQLAS